MTEELQIFGTNKRGQIVIVPDKPTPATGPINQCCCRNKHQPVDGYISTDPSCKIHGLTRYQPTTEGLTAEYEEEARSQRAIVIRRQIIADGRRTK